MFLPVMTVPRDPPRLKTVFDVPPEDVWGTQTLLDHLTEIGMMIARHFDQRGENDLKLLDKVEAFERASNAVLVSIRLSHTLGTLNRRARRSRVAPRARYAKRDPEDAVLYRPLSEVFGEVCIDLAAAASIIGVPPWTSSTPDSLRSLIVALARREAARIVAAGGNPPPQFSAQILEYAPRARDD